MPEGISQCELLRHIFALYRKDHVTVGQPHEKRGEEQKSDWIVHEFKLYCLKRIEFGRRNTAMGERTMGTQVSNAV